MDRVRVTSERIERWPYHRAILEVFDFGRWEWVRVCTMRGAGSVAKLEERAEAIRRLIADVELGRAM